MGKDTQQTVVLKESEDDLVIQTAGYFDHVRRVLRLYREPLSQPLRREGLRVHDGIDPRGPRGFGGHDPGRGRLRPGRDGDRGTKHASRSFRSSLALLEEEDLSEVDLVLGFEHTHVAAAVVDGGARADRTFSVKELARLLGTIQPPNHGDPLLNARDAVARAHMARAQDRRFFPGEDVADPFGRSAKHYESSAKEISGLCRALVTGLFGIEPDQT